MPGSLDGRMFLRWLPIACACAAAAWAQPPRIGPCDIFPADSIWNARVDSLPLDQRSATYVQTVGADRTLFADFGSGLFEGAPIGIPFVLIPGNQARVPVTFQYAMDSDPGPYPIPPDAPIEGGPESRGDRHILALDRDNCVLYEVFAAYPEKDGSWRAGSGAIFPLSSHRLRTAGWTSADAAGLPILPGLARYDEVASGEIRHALRLTVPRTRHAYVWPATHFASTLTEDQYPPMGQRFRLRADFNISGFSADTQVILRALKRYGLILADNGSSWFISGAPDERWNNDRLRELRRVLGSDLEALDSAPLMQEETSAQVRAETRAPVVNSASYAAGFVSAREIVTAFAEGIGADARVYFDGEAAIVVSSGGGQVNATVPDAVARRGSSDVQVESGGRTVFQTRVAVAQAQPGIFVMDGSGRGQAAALNQDYQVNSMGNPIARGDVVMLFATGSGATDLPVTVRIGGRDADVLYSGQAPGLVAGALQVNARVPAGVAAGARTPVVISVGGWTSQAEVTLAVR